MIILIDAEKYLKKFKTFMAKKTHMGGKKT
jgi:hypothetical protein